MQRDRNTRRQTNKPASERERRFHATACARAHRPSSTTTPWLSRRGEVCVTAWCRWSQGGCRPGRILAGRWMAWQWRPGRVPVGWKTVGARCPTRRGGRAGGRTRERSRSPWKQWHSMVVTKQALGEKHKMSRAEQATGGSVDYIHGWVRAKNHGRTHATANQD